MHDPQYALSQINKEQLAREADGTVVVVDGYNRTNVKEWATANHCYEVIAGDYAFNPEATAKWYHKQGYKTVGQQYAIKI